MTTELEGILKCSERLDELEAIRKARKILDQHALPKGKSGGTMGEGVCISLDKLFGSVELHHRFEPCACGDQWCGSWINWSVDIDRHGNRTVQPEWIGVRMECNGKPKKKPSWSLKDAF